MFKLLISIVLAITWISVPLVRVDALPDVIYVGKFELEVH